MTPGEPDRFEGLTAEQLSHLRMMIGDYPTRLQEEHFAAALRREREETLERAAQDYDRDAERLEADARKLDADGQGMAAAAHFHDARVAESNAARIRALASPAAAPAAEVSDLLGRGHVENPREGEPGDAETYSEPVAPAPSAAEKRIAELEAALRDCCNVIDHALNTGTFDTWSVNGRHNVRATLGRGLRILTARTASPAAQGKEPRK